MKFAPILIIIVFGVLAAVFGYLGYLAQKRRREALSKLAEELGWQFVADRDYDHDDQFAHFEIFRRGHSRVAFNTLYGSLDIEGHTYRTKMGDFLYKVTSGSGKSRSTTTYRFSYIIIDLPLPGVPALLIRPEGMFDQLAGFFGFEDIDFESAEFSRRFYVKGSDKRFAYDVIHPQMMEFLLRTTPSTVDIEQNGCCLSDGKRRWESVEFKQQLRWLHEFFELWPRHVKADLQARG